MPIFCRMRVLCVLTVLTDRWSASAISVIEVPASIRLTETATWAALRFVLENLVFALIGLQLRGIVASLDTGDGMVFLAIGAVLLTVIVT